MKKKWFKSGLIFVICICAYTTVSATTIEFWTTQTQSDRMKTIQLIMDTFTALNPNITVKLVPVDEDDMPSQIAAASAAGSLPELIEGSSELMLAFGQEGLLDVTAASKIVNQIGKDRFFQGALKMVEVPKGGNYYAVPYHGWIQGIWYRADWFKAAGLDPPDTWENILKAAKTFYKPEQNKYGILVGTKPVAYSEQCFTHLALSNGAGIFNSSGDLVFNAKQTLETLEFYAELAKYNPTGPQTWRARDYYIQGKLAMFFYSTYIMDDLALAEAAAGSLTGDYFPQLGKSTFDPELVDNTRVVATITKTAPGAYGAVVGLGFVDQKTAVKTDAARKLVEYMYTPASYITFLHMAPGGMNPMLRDIAERSDYLNDPTGVFDRYSRNKIEEIISGLDNIGSFTVEEEKTFPAAGTIYAKQIIPRMIYSVAIDGKKPAEALQWAEDQMKRVINE